MKTHNLRLNQNGAFVPVGNPTMVATGSYQPLTVFHHIDGSESLIAYAGTLLVAIRGEDVVEVATLPSIPSCGVVSGNMLIVMTASGAFRLDYIDETGTWRVAGVLPDLPAISIVATEVSMLTSTIAARTLQRNYPHWQGSLKARDRSDVTADLLEAYRSLIATATEAGCLVQPVICRYKLNDGQGNTLFVSPPIMVSAPDGFQGVDKIIATTDDRETINPYTLSLSAYKLGIVSPQLLSSPWGEIIEEVVIEVSEQLHPIDYSLKVNSRLEEVDATSGNIVMYMPGTAVTMEPAKRRRANMVIKAVLCTNDFVSPTARYPRPFAGGISSTPGEIIQLTVNL